MGKSIPTLDEWRAAEQVARSAELQWLQALSARDWPSLDRLEREARCQLDHAHRLFFRMMGEAARLADAHHYRNVTSGGPCPPDPATRTPSTGQARGHAGGAPLAGFAHDNPPGEAPWSA